MQTKQTMQTNNLNQSMISNTEIKINVIKMSDKMQRYKIKYPLEEKILIHHDNFLFTVSKQPEKFPIQIYDKNYERFGTYFSLWSPYLIDDSILLGNEPRYINMYRLNCTLSLYTNEDTLIEHCYGNQSSINFKSTGIILQETLDTPKHASIFISSPRNRSVEYIGSYLTTPIDIAYKYGLTDLSMKKQTNILDE